MRSLFVVLLLAPAAAQAAVSLVPVTTALAPVYLTHAGDQRLFIVERQGRILIFNRTTGTLLGTPFLDIQSLVSTTGERGLFSMAFHPDYASNGFFYVCYANTAGNIVIARYHVGANPNVAEPGSAATLLVVPHPGASNHNGGQLQTGPVDGHLYVSLGDGGGAGDVPCNAQRGEILLGKILRLDIRQNLTVAPFHGIPTDNPFLAVGDPAGLIRDEIWALGLRNPWRFSFDRANGDLYIGDVGQDTAEEIDLHRASAPAGTNYGWKVMEGTGCFNTNNCPAGTPACNSPALTLPIHQYLHAGSSECSVTGGFRYRGTAASELAGRYVFGDFCSGSIRTLTETTPGNWQVAPLVQGGAGLTSFGEDSNGELYATIGNGVFKLTSSTPIAPVPATRPIGALALALALLLVGLAYLGSCRFSFSIS